MWRWEFVGIPVPIDFLRHRSGGVHAHTACCSKTSLFSATHKHRNFSEFHVKGSSCCAQLEMFQPQAADVGAAPACRSVGIALTRRGRPVFESKDGPQGPHGRHACYEQQGTIHTIAVPCRPCLPGPQPTL